MRFVNPNFHVILIHYPLALLGLGLLIEIFAFLWPRSTFRVAGRWMLLLGALGTIPAATTGIFAKYDVLARASGQQGYWIEIKHAAPLTALQWRFLNQHVLFNSIASVLAVLTIIVWMGGTNRWRRIFHIPAIVLLLISMGLMTYGAWNGGEMVYRTQLATVSQPQAEAAQQQQQADLDSSSGKMHQAKLLDYYGDPLQIHMISAGLLFALAAAALGMTLRRAAVLHQAALVGLGEEPMAATLTPTGVSPLRPTTPTYRTMETNNAVVGETVVPSGDDLGVAPLDPPNIAAATPVPLMARATEPVVVGVTPWRVPAARFWAIAFVLGLLTAAGGWYTITYDNPHSFLDFGGDFQSIIRPSARLTTHLVIGITIIVLTLVMVGASRARSRATIWALGLVIMAAVAAQITVGVLMMYDTDAGPISSFNVETGTPQPTMKQTLTEGMRQTESAASQAGSAIAGAVTQAKNATVDTVHNATTSATTRP